jgi:hypothetical protein
MLVFRNIPFWINAVGSQMKNTVRRVILMTIAIVSIIILSMSESVQAGDWVFRRSYYTHAIPKHLQHQYPAPESRSAYRPALIGNTPGFSVQGGYRIQRVFLRAGNSTDLTVTREGWYREK